jgi:hypothetical protein
MEQFEKNPGDAVVLMQHYLELQSPSFSAVCCITVATMMRDR